MSFQRLIYWTALIGGWSAFFGWLVLEIVIGRWIGNLGVAILMATLIAIPIGGGISLAYGLTNPQIDLLLKRLLHGFAGGLCGGLLGVLLGSCIFGIFGLLGQLAGFFEAIGFVLGWALIGAGIGAGVGISEGIIDRSVKKMRNGLCGGVIGGLVGGVFFYPVTVMASNITGRAVSFVMLGLCVGLAIGLAQVILKEAWLTVEYGFRPGRQMILGKDPVTMGTSEKASLIFIAYGAKGVEPIHLRISKQPDGAYVLEDNQSRTGTQVNGTAIAGPTRIKDGDAIQFGVNKVRFNERLKRIEASPLAEAAPRPAVASLLPVATFAPPIAVAAKPAPQPQEGRCPICARQVVGVPGERRCSKCFTMF